MNLFCVAISQCLIGTNVAYNTTTSLLGAGADGAVDLYFGPVRPVRCFVTPYSCTDTTESCGLLTYIKMSNLMYLKGIAFKSGRFKNFTDFFANIVTQHHLLPYDLDL